MIVEHYPNPNKPATFTTMLTSYGKNKEPDMANGHGLKFNQHWADKMAVPLHVFVSRDKRIQDASRGLMYSKNSRVYPVDWEDYQQKGACRVLDILRSYRDWPKDLEWDDKHLFIVEAVTEENKFNIFRCTAGYVGNIMPTDPAKADPFKV